MCDDMDGWYKPKVVAWCRENLLEKKQMINGLVQMCPSSYYYFPVSVAHAA